MLRWAVFCTIGLACARQPSREEPPHLESVAFDAATADATDGEAARDANDAETTLAPVRLSGPWGIAFVTSTDHPAPIVYFHGMGASPEDSCSYFEPATVAVSGALMCPRGNRPPSEGGAFGGPLSVKRVSFDVARARVAEIAPLGSSGTLLGFSSGAAVAVELAVAEPGRWTSLVLMSMKLNLKPAALKTAGVKRVVFAAGELDGTYASMMAAARATNAAGVEAKFVTLGKVGHHFAVDMETRMVDALRWVRE